MKKWVLAVLLCAAAVGLCACGPNTLVLVTDQPKDAVQKLVEPYAQKAGVKITVVAANNDELLRAAGLNTDGQNGGGQNGATAQPAQVADILLTQNLITVGQLRMANALAQYSPAGAIGLPSGARGQGYWYGFGGRGWVLARNTDMVADEGMTNSFEDLSDDKLPAKTMAIPNIENNPYYPLAIFTFWGREQSLSFYQALVFKQAAITGSTRSVAEGLASGKLALGLTTYADAKAQKDAGKPVDFSFPDNMEGEIGSYVQLNCVALPAASKNQKMAQPLEDYLLSPEAEALSIQLGLSDVALRENSLGAPVVRPLNIAPEKVLASAQSAEEMFRSVYQQ